MSSGVSLAAPPGEFKTGESRLFDGSDFLLRGGLQLNQLLSTFTPESKVGWRYQLFMKESGGRAPLAGFALSQAKDGKEAWSGIAGPDGTATFGIARNPASGAFLGSRSWRPGSDRTIV